MTVYSEFRQDIGWQVLPDFSTGYDENPVIVSCTRLNKVRCVTADLNRMAISREESICENR